MQWLLDTHVFLWYVLSHPKLSDKAKNLIDARSGLCLSIASLWEIAIKINVGKLQLSCSFDDLLVRLVYLKAEIIPLSVEDTRTYMNLSLLDHRDPFDRILISQAINHSLVIISADNKFDAYPIQRIWA